MLCAWPHLRFPRHPITVSQWTIQALSLDYLGWSFTAGDGPESSKCQLEQEKKSLPALAG